MSLPIVSCLGPRPLAPRLTEFTGRFWSSLQRGCLETTQCLGCQRISFPPAPTCRGCGGRESEWVELSGRGTLYSCTTIHAAPALFSAQVPYQVAIVDLAEGIRLVAGVLPNGELPALDSDCELVVTQYEDGPLFAVRGME